MSTLARPPVNAQFNFLEGAQTKQRNTSENRNKNTLIISKLGLTSVLICEQDHPKREQNGERPIGTAA